MWWYLPNQSGSSEPARDSEYLLPKTSVKRREREKNNDKYGGILKL